MTDTVRPGNSPGVITFNPSLIAGLFDDPFYGNGQSPTFEMEIIGGYGMPDISDDADRIESSHSMLFTGGTLKLILNNPEVGSYTIFKLTGTTGTISGFSSLNVLYSVNGGAFTSAKPANLNFQVNASSIIVNITGSVLPVELMSFKGKNTEGGNLLTWQTAAEINTSHFDIERSTDGKVFEKIGQTKATGTNSNYAYLDKAPFGGWGLYYRLKINDLDGKVDYSKTISISRNGKSFLKTYPNPVADILTLEADLAGDYQIINLLGQQVLAGTVSPLGVRGLDVSALPKGAYFLKVGVEQVKFVKQ